MWIVRVALQRPYTFVVLALLLIIMGPLTISQMPTDIFPDIKIPVISVVFNYTGLPPDEIAGRITSAFERPITTIVNDVQHVESQSYPGISVTKVFFQPGVDINLAMAQVTAFCQTSIRNLPPGSQPPLILKYNASSVPILQLALASETLSEASLFDQANQFLRTQLATVRGASVPYPYGGAQRQVQIDLDPKALQAKGLSAQDVTTAIANQNLILPAGTEKIGSTEYDVRLNASPLEINKLNDLPMATVNGATIYLHDVGRAHDGHPPQQNIVRVNGKRAVLMTIQKTGTASTLDIIGTIKTRLPQIRTLAPEGMTIDALGDQSVFVKAAVKGVITEGASAAVLTGLMILLFLGSWRSTVIIVISIPLSILASIICLSILGQTINIMTLGGLALAVGILVDDATVAIENINYHLEHGKEVETAILDGAQQIAIPALVSTLSICIVFIPMFFLGGVPKYLFVPLAESVVFAMLASYLLSRTLIPTMANYLLHKHQDKDRDEHREDNVLQRFQKGFEARFERLREGYHGLLFGALNHRRPFILGFLGVVAVSMLLAVDFGPLPGLGQDFFPAVDSGQIKLHFRAKTGLRVEETARLADRIEGVVRQVIPAHELVNILDNIGLPVSGINLSYSNSGTIGSSDGDIQITLAEDHQPTDSYIATLRDTLPGEFPGVIFAFLPADIVSQILNFGLPSPIDVQIIGRSPQNSVYADHLLGAMRRIPGASDLRIQQPLDKPLLSLNVDRARAGELGLTQHDVATSLLVTLSGSFQTAPTFFLEASSGVSYPVATQAPQYTVNSIASLQNIEVTSSSGAAPQILGALATLNRSASPAIVSHSDAQTLIDIFGSVDGRDLGGVASDIQAAIDGLGDQLPKGTRVKVGGQIDTMHSAFTGLLWGLLGAIVLVYLLIVVNFQSWLDPFIIITALPAAIAGIVWMLFLSHTTLSVPALTGAIMCMGVATANSILVISFAREKMQEGSSAMDAALEAGFTRFRPVLMTALAMMIGMVPMALGLGDGGEQNAPLGRAVIGGLMFATVATLLFVPTIFCLIHSRREQRAGAANGAALEH